MASKKRHSIILLISLSYLMGCSSDFQITTTQTRKVYPNEKSFAISQNENTNQAIDQETIQAMEREIKKQMKHRGFIESDKHPDLILFITYYNQKVKLPELENIKDNEENTFQTVLKKAGTNTLVFQLLDVSSNSIVWRSFASHLPNNIQTRQYIHVTKWLLADLKHNSSKEKENEERLSGLTSR